MDVDWEPSIKHYPHFDKSIRPSDIRKLVKDPKRVASNSFYPFLLYEKHHQPFRTKAVRPDKRSAPFDSPAEGTLTSIHIIGASFQPNTKASSPARALLTTSSPTEKFVQQTVAESRT